MMTNDFSKFGDEILNFVEKITDVFGEPKTAVPAQDERLIAALKLIRKKCNDEGEDAIRIATIKEIATAALLGE
jgi:hypothetical protein